MRARARRSTRSRRATEEGDGNVSKHVRPRVRRRRRGRSRTRTWWSRTTTSSTARRTRRSSRTAPSRTSAPTALLTVWSATQITHYVHRALARVLELPAAAHPRDPALPRRRVRRQVATPSASSSASPSWRCSRGRPVKMLWTREEVFYAHRGRHPMQMRYRTSAQAGRPHHRRRREDPDRRRRLQLVRAGDHVLRRPAPDRARTTSRPTASTRRACSRTSRRAARSAATARCSRASRSRCSSTRLAEQLGHRPDRDPAHQLPGRAHADGQRPAHHLERLPRVPRRGRARVAAGRSGAASCPTGAGSASPARCTSRAPTTRSTRTRCRRPGIQLKVDRSGIVTVFTGGNDIGQGSNSVVRLHRRRGARHAASSTCAWSRPTPTCARWTSAPTQPRHVHGRQRHDRRRRKLRAQIVEAVAEKLARRAASACA